VEVLTKTEALRLRTNGRGNATLVLRREGEEYEVEAELVLNCTYSRLNHLLTGSNASPLPVKHELTELAIVEPPAELAGAAVTVMDGPFFSLMPYPSRGLFTLSHVRYTPHCSWHDDAKKPIADGESRLSQQPSRFVHMTRDAERYLPVMRGTRYVDSLWEVKTVMPRSEQDDSRPILFRRSAQHPACITVLGAKIDSVYDVEDALRKFLDTQAPVSASA
jgi:glycine/D-amino acid oxidase-like deaminating enzyme